MAIAEIFSTLKSLKGVIEFIIQGVQYVMEKAGKEGTMLTQLCKNVQQTVDDIEQLAEERPDPKDQAMLLDLAKQVCVLCVSSSFFSSQSHVHPHLLLMHVRVYSWRPN